jgi:hypothetical protein
MAGFNFKQIIMFVILSLLYFILCRCNNNGFSVGIKEDQNCDNLKITEGDDCYGNCIKDNYKCYDNNSYLYDCDKACTNKPTPTPTPSPTLQQMCQQKIDDCMDKGDCSNVDFTNCNLYNTNLTNLNLSGAILNGTTLSDNLDGTNLSEAQWDQHTVWEDFNFPNSSKSTKCNASTILPEQIMYFVKTGVDNIYHKKWYIESLHCDDFDPCCNLRVDTHEMKSVPLIKCGEKYCDGGDRCCHEDTCCNMNDGCGVFKGCGIF